MPQAGAGKRGAAVRPVRRSGHLRPKLDALDLAVHLWRAKGLMLAVFLPLAAISAAAAFSLPASYVSVSRLLVATGSNEAERGGQVGAEAALLRSPVVAEAALKRVTLARAYPAMAHTCKPDQCAKLGAEAIAQALVTETADGSTVITARLAHADPSVSADLLNAVVEAYLAYRADVFADSRSDSLRTQREALEKVLAAIEADIRSYLFTNNLTDLAAERETLHQLYQTASTDLLSAQSQLRQAEAQLANYRRQIAQIPPERDLYVEDTRQQALQALRLERNDKAAKFGAHAPQVRDLDRQIAQAEAALAFGTLPDGRARRGPNPLYQQIEAAMVTLQSEVQALRSQEAELRAQISGFEARQRRVVELAPGLQEMERRRDLAERSIKALADREMDLRTRNALTSDGMSRIRVLEPATPPVHGTSLKAPALLLGLMLSAMAALLTGLARAVSRRGFATPGSLERTLNLPVLAVIGKR